jgi:sugar/nucleoside kinase (ribokinase family)
METQMAAIYCIGTAHLDNILTFSNHAPLRHTTAATSVKAVGGVVYNIATVLRQLGNDVAFSGVLGYDADAEHVIKDLKQHDIDCSAIIRSKANTGSYIAFHSQDGEMMLAAIDIDIYNQLTPRMFGPIIDRLSKVENWVLDSNFSQQTYSYLAIAAKAHHISVYLTISSIYGGEKIIPLLPITKALFGNVEEIQYLAHKLTNSGYENIWGAMQLIADLGTETIFATDGANGVYVLSKGQKIYRPAIPVTNVVSVNGAGDTFSAATMNGLLNNNQLLDSIDAGLLAAAQKISGLTIISLSKSRSGHTFMC